MRYRRRTLIFLAVITLAIIALLFRSYFYEGVVHLKSNDKEFKIKPENSIESTILHREKEVYDHVLHSNSSTK
ncbi:MAG: hypothetical protein ACR5K9_06475 [Wolbachia sp.]